MDTPRLDAIAEAVISLAESWQNLANKRLTEEEKVIQEQMGRLLARPKDKVILTKMIDQSFRSHDAARVADQINSLLREYGVPDFFSAIDKLLVQMFLGVGRHLPEFSVPKVIDKMRHDSHRVIIPSEYEILHAYLQKRKRQGVRINLNRLGEAVLGEAEALSRLQSYIADLKNPDIEYISVKISTIYSQINPLDFEQTVGVIKDRLGLLIETAGEHYYVRNDGRRVKKFVNLDMEEYRDMEITIAAFVKTLEMPGLKSHSAGIALQAYLPDTYGVQQDLTTWARKRVAQGGSPIKIRIVKGANMEMELFEAAINNWPLAPYDNKLDVDANYKRMVEFGMRPDNIKAVHVGIASHNLFDLAFAYHLALKNEVIEGITIEMLEGMADHVRRAVQENTGNLLLYTPTASKEQFINAIAYLIRRLDENTAEENFLRHACGLKTGSREWDFLKDHFVTALKHKDNPRLLPHRIQNRSAETFQEPMTTFYTEEFNNEANTDWSLAANRKWAQHIRAKWKKHSSEQPLKIPLVIAGKDIFAERRTRDCPDISRIHESICVATHALADGEDVMRAVAAAKADPDGWRTGTHSRRHEILSRVALELRRARGDLIGAAAANTGKVFAESDPEVSEAIDFAGFYPEAVKKFSDLKHVSCRGKGVGVVISPWNFPIAIPCGGILAALASGNTVIFKPASAAVLVGWQLCQCIWKAGVSKNVLQFVPCSGSDTGVKLTRHPDVDFIIFTGATETGLSILKERPGVLLAAETGGKNATIVTAMADRDQAIKHVVNSAYGNSGQKCSATSLLILEKEVYEDETFQKQLVDAAGSVQAGSAWNFANKMGPLIQPPTGDLKRALSNLEPGEAWALRPQMVDQNPYMWTPGIKWGTSAGSYTYLTEFFGPLLGVMSATDLEHAIELVNGTGYGLTSAIESLDRREQERWKNGIKAGNLYINRETTGAVVLRQPFGGVGKSALGAGIKAGFWNYVTQFMDFDETGLPPAGPVQHDHFLLRLIQEWKLKLDLPEYEAVREDLIKTVRAVKSYLYHYGQEFSRQKDYFHLRGQDNVIRYLPIGKVVIRLHPEDNLFEVLARIAAARISGCKPRISIPDGLENRVTAFLHSQDGHKLMGKIPVVYQTDAELVATMSRVQRIRYAAPERVPDNVLTAASHTGYYVSRTKVLMEGRIELLQYFIEQSICDNYHRYGNLGDRALSTDD